MKARRRSDKSGPLSFWVDVFVFMPLNRASPLKDSCFGDLPRDSPLVLIRIVGDREAEEVTEGINVPIDRLVRTLPFKGYLVRSIDLTILPKLGGKPAKASDCGARVKGGLLHRFARTIVSLSKTFGGSLEAMMASIMRSFFAERSSQMSQSCLWKALRAISEVVFW